MMRWRIFSSVCISSMSLVGAQPEYNAATENMLLGVTNGDTLTDLARIGKLDHYKKNYCAQYRLLKRTLHAERDPEILTLFLEQFYKLNGNRRVSYEGSWPLVAELFSHAAEHFITNFEAKFRILVEHGRVSATVLRLPEGRCGYATVGGILDEQFIEAVENNDEDAIERITQAHKLLLHYQSG